MRSQIRVLLLSCLGIVTSILLFQNCSNLGSQPGGVVSNLESNGLTEGDGQFMMASVSLPAIDATGFTIERTARHLLLGSFSMRPNQQVLFEDLSLAYQADGNLVLYQRLNPSSSIVLWTSEAQRNCSAGNCEAVFDRQVGLRLLDNGVAYWQSRNVQEGGLSLELSRVAPFTSIKASNGRRVWTGLGRSNWLSFIDPIAGIYGPSRTGITDYRELLSEASRGNATLRKIHVIKVYQQFIQQAPAAELQAFFRFLDDRNIALAMEYGPVELSAAELARCGQGVEGAQPAGAARFLAQKIRQNGGRLAFVAMDEPVYYSHYPSAPNLRPPFVSCQFSIDELARRTAQTYLDFRAEFADVVYGDTEPFFALPAGAGATEWLAKYVNYIERFEFHAGVPLGFVHDDTHMDTLWESRVRPLQAELNRRQISYGMIWNGSVASSNSVNWVAEAVGKVQKYKRLALKAPEQNLFQSWDSYPTRVLPDNSPDSFLFLANYYFSQQNPVPSNRVRIPVYRFYSPSRGDHDYNVGTVPRPGFNLEGEAFRVYQDSSPSSMGLYRCRVPANDRTYLSTSSQCEGMQVLGRVGFVSSVLGPESPSPLYRCFNRIHGRHFVTKNPVECASNGWTVEGPIGFLD